MFENTERDDFGISEDENGAVVNLAHTEMPNSLYQGPSTYYIESAERDKLNQLPAAFTVIFRIVLPIIISTVAAVIAFNITGSQRFVWGAVGLGAFLWFALQFAWVDEREKLNSDGEF